MSNKGTVLYIGGFELPDKNAAAQRVIANGKLLRSMGYNVVFCGVTNDELIPSINAPQKYYDFDCYALPYPTNKIDWVSFIFKSKMYKALVDKYSDVSSIICYNIPSGSLYKMLKYSKKRNIKVFADCTEWYEAPKEGNIVHRLVKKIDIDLRMNKLHFKLDGIISISEYLHVFYKNQGLTSIKVPPLVDLIDDKWENNQVHNNEVRTFVYSGSPFSLSNTASVKDRLDLIILAMANLKSQNLKFAIHIVGIKKEEFLSFYPELKNKVDFLADYLVFFGKVAHKKSIEILKRSDFSIFLRDTNLVTKAGFPTKFVESISCGIPVLTNDSSNISDYLISGVNGFLVSTENLESIEETIKKSLEITDDTLKEMKLNCKQAETFSYPNYIHHFKQLF
jgi:glycosyltransferase involved in cell wall biosynthesis